MSNFSTSACSSNVIEVTADANLSPKDRGMEMAGKSEQMLNADGVIALMRDAGGTPGRAMYRDYRKATARLKHQFPELEGKELRLRAVLEAFEEAAHRIVEPGESSRST